MNIKCIDKKRRAFIIVRLLRFSVPDNPKHIYGIQCMDCEQVVIGDLTYPQANSAKRLYASEIANHVCQRK